MRSEKKIELQDIEEDNLKSENHNDEETNDARSQGPDPTPTSLEALKSGFLRYYQSPNAEPQQPRYVQQYDVTEPPVEEPKQHYVLPNPQQIGYFSNTPMQVYLVPQYYNEPQEQTVNQHNAGHYSAPTSTRVASYHTAPEPVQTQTNYIQIPNYVPQTGKTFVQQQHSEPIAYFTYNSQPAKAVHPTVTPTVSYHTPVVHYTPSASQHGPPKEYVHQKYQSAQYTDTNAVEEVQETVEQRPHNYPTHTEIIYHNPPKPEYTQTFALNTPLKTDYHHKHIVEVPHTSQIIYKTPVQHVPHIPKVLPLQRPPTKVYTSIEHFVPQPYTHRPPEPYGPPFKRRPTSLLDSYIPSSVQIEYMKRGFAKDPLEAYEALSSGRHLQPTQVAPRHFERGFLPNQMYHTAGGGITFGHYKRSPKLDRIPHH